MKAYKGFNKDMTCTPNGKVFQYEVGKEYTEEKAAICNVGFHACEYPLDCFGYYGPNKSVYHEVELGDDAKGGGDKMVSTKIKIGAEMNLSAIIKASFDYVKTKTTNNKQGGYMSALQGGDRLALQGGYMSALQGGYRSALQGSDLSALQGGDRSALQGGDRSALQGGHMSALQGGDRSALQGGDMSALQGGYRSALQGSDLSALQGGDMSALQGGDRSVVYGCGKGATVKGGNGSVLALAEFDDHYKLVKVHTMVAGQDAKADTWYQLINGKMTEVE